MSAGRKLSEAQNRALNTIGVTTGKSGAFWRELGISYATLNALEDRGLVESYGDSWRSGLRGWRITEIGRAAIAKAQP